MTNTLSEASRSFLEKQDIHQHWETRYLNPDIEPIYEMIFDRIAANLRTAGASIVLDAGCGYCRHASRLAVRGFAIQGVDFSPAAIAAARQYIRSRGLDDRITVTEGSLLQLPYPDGQFRGVVCWGVLMHIPDVETALAELCRVVAPGGRLVLGENSMSSLDFRYFEPALALVKRALGRKLPERRRTRFGAEDWSGHGDGGLMVRKSDMTAIIETCAAHGLRLVERSGGQFTEAFAHVPLRALRRLIHRFNERKFRDQGPVDRFMGNLLVFERTGA